MVLVYDVQLVTLQYTLGSTLDSLNLYTRVFMYLVNFCCSYIIDRTQNISVQRAFYRMN